MASPSASAEPAPVVAIVDYGSGNLFSLEHALRRVGAAPERVTTADRLSAAEGIVLPGVGAFGHAMRALDERGLAEPLRSLAAGDRPLLAICLGMQLLLEESLEFGSHPGLGIIPGQVRPLEPPAAGRWRVPHVGWAALEPAGQPWSPGPLAGLAPGAEVYFVHSFQACPADPGWVHTRTPWGDGAFCSSLARGALFACQFHPERSGPTGTRILSNFVAELRARREGSRARA